MIGGSVLEQERIMAALRQVAAENGTTLETVLQEINEIIRIGTESDDPSVRKRWAEIPCAGTVPTVLELVDYLVKQIR